MEHPCVVIYRIVGTKFYKFSRGDMGTNDNVRVVHVVMTNSIESAAIAEKIFDIACSSVNKTYSEGVLSFEEHKECVYNELLDTCVLISDNYVCNELGADLIYIKETDSGYTYKILRSGVCESVDSLPNVLGEFESVDDLAKYLENENTIVLYD